MSFSFIEFASFKVERAMKFYDSYVQSGKRAKNAVRTYRKMRQAKRHNHN